MLLTLSCKNKYNHYSFKRIKMNILKNVENQTKINEKETIRVAKNIENQTKINEKETIRVAKVEYVINPSVLYNSKLKSLYNSDEGDIVVNVGNLKRATYEHVTYGNYKKK